MEHSVPNGLEPHLYLVKYPPEKVPPAAVSLVSPVKLSTSLQQDLGHREGSYTLNRVPYFP